VPREVGEKALMARAKPLAAALCAALALSGCGLANDVLFPSLSGEDPNGSSVSSPSSGSQAREQIAASPAEANDQPTLSPAAPPPRLGSGNFTPTPPTQAAPTGTFVGQKVQQFRGELERLQAQVSSENTQLQQIRREAADHSQRYHATVGAINAKLQVGTTPGNPILVSQWNAAQSLLDQIGSDVAKLSSLSNDVAATSSLSSYLLESTRAAYGLSGAVDEDHRQLAILEDEVNRTVVLIDRLLNELSGDVSRQSAYLSGERRNLTALALAIKNGEMYGSSLSNAAFSSSAPALTQRSAGPVTGEAARRPLVVIRFDRPNVSYEQALYSALSGALARRPGATFDLVAVAPQSGNAAEVTSAQNRSKRDAERVLRSMSEMGLPMDRVRLSAMTSQSAQSNEVHVYVR
jgi:hypothetical protein